MRIEKYMDLAFTVAKNGTCPRAKVGAVLINRDRIIGLGFNGSPRKLLHCDEVGCKIVNDHCIRAVHSEANAIVNAAASGASTEGSILLCTHSPCLNCAHLIINAGIKTVYYSNFYKDAEALDVLRSVGIVVAAI